MRQSPKDLPYLSRTVWKFQDFSVPQILREMNLEEFKSSEITILVILSRDSKLC